MNYKVYNAQMVKSSYDKLFFVDKVFDVDVIVDFGCADGAITEMIKGYFPEAVVIGYDKYQKNESTSDIIYAKKLSEIKKLIKGKKALLVMNSVVHEIFNYERNPFSLLGMLFSMGFEYVWIRDLYIKPSVFGDEIAFSTLAERLREKYPEQVAEFEKVYGSVFLSENALHFLMKFRYVENWKRELKEDYTKFRWNFPQMERLLYAKGYEEEIRDFYVLPYVRKINMEEFDIDLKNQGYTHYRGLFRKIKRT